MMRFNRRQIIYAIVILMVAIALLCVYLLFDPTESRWFPQCIFYKLTGWKCAGCGSQRAIHAMLTGDFAEAWRQNALLMSILPLIVYMIWLEFVRKSRPILYARFYSRATILTIIFVVIGWTIVRNIFNL